VLSQGREETCFIQEYFEMMNHLIDMKFYIKPLLCLLFLASPALAQDGKPTILITGANRGLGLELAKQYVDKGYQVYGTARKPVEATELKETGATVLQLDVTSEESIAALAKEMEGKSLDILFNNAGYFGPNKIGEKQATVDNVTRKEIEQVHAVNTMGPLFVTQALMPNLRAGKTKKIVNMSSRAGMLSRPGAGAMGYRMSKAGVNMVTVLLNSGLKKEGFIVVSVAPGHNKTDMGSKRGKELPKQTMPQLIEVIDNLTKKQGGGFWFYDGKKIAW